MSRCKRPRNRFDAISGLAVSSLKSCNLKGAFMCAPTVQQLFVGETDDPGLTGYSFIFPRSAQYLRSRIGAASLGIRRPGLAANSR
jgi:hypothetical protein